MPKLYILVKRKGSNAWKAAIPVKNSVSIGRAKSVVRRSIKPGYTALIVTSGTLKSMLRRSAVRMAKTGRSRTKPRHRKARHRRTRRMRHRRHRRMRRHRRR